MRTLCCASPPFWLGSKSHLDHFHQPSKSGFVFQGLSGPMQLLSSEIWPKFAFGARSRHQKYVDVDCGPIYDPTARLSLQSASVLKRRWNFDLRPSRTSGRRKIPDLWPELDLWLALTESRTSGTSRRFGLIAGYEAI